MKIHQSEENKNEKCKKNIFVKNSKFINRKYRIKIKGILFPVKSSTKMKTTFQSARMPLRFKSSTWVEILKSVKMIVITQ
jgi:hypothetical protein